jgi:hypothetical protein
MPPKKMYPPNWRRYRRHNRNPVNSFQAIAPLTAQEKGYFLKGVVLSQKLDPKTSIDDTRYNPSQRRVSFYILKTTPVCFTCVQRTA